VTAAFEQAAEAVVRGRVDELRALLAADASLARAHSPRAHGATLLAYLAGNGVEAERQTTPANAVEVARLLLGAGADADATALLYGGPWTILTLLVSSVHPHRAGVQAALVDALLDGGARVEGPSGDGEPLATAIAFGFPAAADALAARGACVGNLVTAAALGRQGDLERWCDAEGVPRRPTTVYPKGGAIGASDAESSDELWRKAFLFACAHDRVAMVAHLRERRGFDIDLRNSRGETPLHLAAYFGRAGLARYLLAEGAARDVVDLRHGATPATWAKHLGHVELAALLAPG